MCCPRRAARFALAALALAGWPARAASSAPAPAEDARRVLTAATARAADIPAQAAVLVRLAWPPDGSRQPAVQSLARAELVGYGEYALGALRHALRSTDPLWHADMVATFIEASRTVTAGRPADLQPGLDGAIWFGSSAARRLAIREIGRHRYPPAVLPIIDAILDDPGLTLVGVRALGAIGDPRARFQLGRMLSQATPPIQREAAAALARLGEPGLIVLRQAVRSSDAAERVAALEALLPAARPEDADLLHGYVADHAGEDAERIGRVRARALELEAQLERQRDAEAASEGAGADDQQP
jgi:hypothetical protein